MEITKVNTLNLQAEAAKRRTAILQAFKMASLSNKNEMSLRELTAHVVLRPVYASNKGQLYDDLTQMVRLGVLEKTEATIGKGVLKLGSPKKGKIVLIKRETPITPVKTNTKVLMDGFEISRTTLGLTIKYNGMVVTLQSATNSIIVGEGE